MVPRYYRRFPLPRLLSQSQSWYNIITMTRPTSSKTSKAPTSTKKASTKTSTKASATKSTKASEKPSTPKLEHQAEQIVSDYNGYDYKKIFWEDADRAYEDMADRIAIRRLLPEQIDDFVDIAGGYGRLAKEYLSRAKHPTLFDYSQTELDQAKAEFGNQLRTQQGDIYHLPFKANSFNALIMVRATHHFADMPAVSKELHRILKPGGIAVVEVANKRTLPKMFRYWLRRSDVNPFDRNPSSLKDLNNAGFFNYHPKYIEQVFRDAGFEIAEVLSVSNFRSAKLKKIFGTKKLVGLEKRVQKPLASIRFAPSIYYKLVKLNSGDSRQTK